MIASFHSLKQQLQLLEIFFFDNKFNLKNIIPQYINVKYIRNFFNMGDLIIEAKKYNIMGLEPSKGNPKCNFMDVKRF